MAINAGGNGVSSIYEYDINTNTWNQLGQDILADAGYDGSGTSVSLSGDGRIVALGESGYGDSDVGFICVYEYNINTNTWNQVGDDIYGESDFDESIWFRCITF